MLRKPKLKNNSPIVPLVTQDTTPLSNYSIAQTSFNKNSIYYSDVNKIANWAEFPASQPVKMSFNNLEAVTQIKFLDNTDNHVLTVNENNNLTFIGIVIDSGSSNWSSFPASTTVQLGSNNINNVNNIYFGDNQYNMGVDDTQLYFNGTNLSPSTWSQYPASTTVDLSSNLVSNVSELRSNGNITMNAGYASEVGASLQLNGDGYCNLNSGPGSDMYLVNGSASDLQIVITSRSTIPQSGLIVTPTKLYFNGIEYNQTLTGLASPNSTDWGQSSFRITGVNPNLTSSSIVQSTIQIPDQVGDTSVWLVNSIPTSDAGGTIIFNFASPITDNSLLTISWFVSKI
jgi:hypothetical protein